MTLAYVFWHWPARAAGYEELLQGFHDALGVPGSVTFRLQRAPWDGAAPQPYEDWYPVDGWAALGELNDLAVGGARRAPHDAAARAAGDGTAGVYRRLREGPPLHAVTHAAWFGKPPGVGYEDFERQLADALRGTEAAVWQRQLVLGPAPEYAVLGTSAAELPWAPMLTEPRTAARGG